MILNEEQLRFFYNEILGELEWSDEEEESGIDPLAYVLGEVRKMRKEINRLSGVSVSRWQMNSRPTPRAVDVAKSGQRN